MKQPRAGERHRLLLSQSKLQLLGDAHLDFIMRQLINSHCPLFPFPPQEVTEAEQLTADRQACLPGSPRSHESLPRWPGSRRTSRCSPLQSRLRGRRTWLESRVSRAGCAGAGRKAITDFPWGRDFSAGASRGRHRMGMR